MSDSLRAFFALPVPIAARSPLVELQRRLRRGLPGAAVRWMAEEQLHLTLKFLGQVRRADLGAFAELAERQAQQLIRTSYPVTALTAFPGPRRARVVVVRLLDADQRLERLARSLDQAAAALGVTAESRAFRPHVTLGRVKIPTDLTAAFDVGATGLPPIGFERLVLYSSEPGARGSTYRVLRAADLRIEESQA